MSDGERSQLIATMGANIGAIDMAIRSGQADNALSAFAKFMAAAGFLAQEIDELNLATGN